MPIPTIREIEKLDKSDLIKVYKLVKKFKSLYKDVWEKSKWLFHFSFFKTQKFIVEYFPAIQKDNLENIAISIFKSQFWIEVDPLNIEWKENKNLKWWARLFLNDDMIDISFDKINSKIHIWWRKHWETI